MINFSVNFQSEKVIIICPSKKDDCKKFERNHVTTAFNFLNTKKERIYSVYDSKHNSNR